MKKCPVCDSEFSPSTGGRPQTYCSVSCRKKVYNEKRRFKTYAKCSIDDCKNQRRTSKSSWCEMHYIRWYRNGDTDSTLIYSPSKTCRHCGVEMDTKRSYCDVVCKRRARMGVPGREITCVTCHSPIALEKLLGSLFCSTACSTMAIRARRVALEPNQLWVMLQDELICEICKEPVDLPHLDHNHINGKFRGILCSGCNVGLGMMKESIANLSSAIDYLKRVNQ